MIRKAFMAMLIVSGAMPLAAAESAPKEPAETLASVAIAPSRGVSGRFAMTVAAAEKTSKGTFLNSTTDYRGADNLTISIKPVVAKMLGKRFGAPPEKYLLGKRVVVDGVAKQAPIYHMLAGRPHDLARVSVHIYLDKAAQMISAE